MLKQKIIKFLLWLPLFPILIGGACLKPAPEIKTREETVEESIKALNRIREQCREQNRLTHSLMLKAYKSPKEGFKEFYRIILSFPKDETERWKRNYVIRALPWLSTLDSSLEGRCVELVVSIINSDPDEKSRVEAIAAISRMVTRYPPPLSNDDSLEPSQRPYRADPPKEPLEFYACSYEYLLTRDEIVNLLSNKLLDDPSWKVREIAALSLGVSPNKRACQPLIHSAQNSDERWEVREAAIISLGDRNEPEAIKTLLSLLHSNAGGIAMEMIRRFTIEKQKYDKRIARVIGEILVSKEWVLKPEALKIIGAYYDKERKQKYLDLIRFCLNDSHPFVRRETIKQIWYLRDREMIPKLKWLAENDEDEEVRKAAKEVYQGLSEESK